MYFLSISTLSRMLKKKSALGFLHIFLGWIGDSRMERLNQMKYFVRTIISQIQTPKGVFGIENNFPSGSRENKSHKWHSTLIVSAQKTNLTFTPPL